MTQVNTGGNNVLTALDRRVPTSFIWSLTLLATIGGFLFGYDTANIGSALNFVPYPLTGFALAAAIGAAVDWLANFALIEVFPTWQNSIGLGWVLICFAGLCLLAVLFVSIFLPETKGHSVEEITRLFERQATGRSGTQVAA
ncbi:MAG: MFS transporter [Gemmatimonadota bacterium]